MTSRRGFTLVELVVALVVTGVVVLAAHTGLAAISDGWARSHRAAMPVWSGATARGALEGWLRSATFLPGTGPFRGVDVYRAGQSVDEVTFDAGDCGALRPGPCRIRLWLDRDPATPRTGLLAELAVARESVVISAETLTVAPAATGLELRYLVPQPRGTAWVDGWESSDMLPRAVQLHLSTLEAIRLGPGAVEASRLPPLLQLPLTVPVEGALW